MDRTAAAALNISIHLIHVAILLHLYCIPTLQLGFLVSTSHFCVSGGLTYFVSVSCGGILSLYSIYLSIYLFYRNHPLVCLTQHTLTHSHTYLLMHVMGWIYRWMKFILTFYHCFPFFSFCHHLPSYSLSRLFIFSSDRLGLLGNGIRWDWRFLTSYFLSPFLVVLLHLCRLTWCGISDTFSYFICLFLPLI